MIREIKVNLKGNYYKIIVGSNILKKVPDYLTKLKIGRDAYVITNSLIMARYGKILASALERKGFSVRFKLVPDTEKSKSLKTAADIISDLAFYSPGKRIFILALGGGVIGDLAGFVSAIYKRGIAYAQIPTTLLAQVDSSIGGKTAVDLNIGKNLIGAFYQPRLVVSDVTLLKSLDLRQIRSGLAEVIKYGLIKDAQLFKFLEDNYQGVINLKQKDLEFVIARCAAIKARIISLDEKEEKGIRTILNFGHTLGHAIEAAGRYKAYNHGEAVALGMLAASFISQRQGLIKARECQQVKDIIRKVGLPVEIGSIPYKEIIRLHFYDKKFIGKKNRFILLQRIGQAKVREDIPIELIKESLQSISIAR